MKTIGNILWVIFGGIEWCIALLLCSAFCFISIVGIPMGIQLFKMAKFVLWPFGQQVVYNKVSGLRTLLNIIWAILFGWELALGFLFTGILYCLTIIGIPFGQQYFKLATFVFTPLGHSFK